MKHNPLPAFSRERLDMKGIWWPKFSIRWKWLTTKWIYDDYKFGLRTYEP